MTDRSVVTYLTHCATLLSDNIGEETTYIVTLYLMFISINITPQHTTLIKHFTLSTSFSLFRLTLHKYRDKIISFKKQMNNV